MIKQLLAFFQIGRESTAGRRSTPPPFAESRDQAFELTAEFRALESRIGNRNLDGDTLAVVTNDLLQLAEKAQRQGRIALVEEIFSLANRAIAHSKASSDVKNNAQMLFKSIFDRLAEENRSDSQMAASS